MKMLKRILLIAGLGVSFISPAFAGSAKCGTGEQNSVCVDYTGSQCEISMVLKEAEKGFTPVHTSGTAGVANGQ